jgi:hypothetical protein
MNIKKDNIIKKLDDSDLLFEYFCILPLSSTMLFKDAFGMNEVV